MLFAVWTEVGAGESMDPTKRRQHQSHDTVNQWVMCTEYIVWSQCSVECWVCTVVLSVNRGPTKRRQRQSEQRQCQSDSSNACLLTPTKVTLSYLSVCLLNLPLSSSLEECPLASVITRETTLWKWSTVMVLLALLRHNFPHNQNHEVSPKVYWSYLRKNGPDYSH